MADIVDPKAIDFAAYSIFFIALNFYINFKFFIFKIIIYLKNYPK
jgi:hypothetical protein